MARMYRSAVKYPTCETKTTLLLAWQSATDSYSRVLSTLTGRIGTMSPDEYHQLRLDVEKARKVSKEARDAFEAHIYAHCCMSGEVNLPESMTQALLS
jgi:hypothetical protein